MKQHQNASQQWQTPSPRIQQQGEQMVSPSVASPSASSAPDESTSGSDGHLSKPRSSPFRGHSLTDVAISPPQLPSASALPKPALPTSHPQSRPQLEVQRQSVQAQHDIAPSAIQRLAREGIKSPSSSLPYARTLQHAFGRYDIGHVQAHIGPQATIRSRAMGAQAFTTGNHVVLAGKPSLATVAHEATHVVQQQHGVHLAQGVGTAGDRYERHADAVAQRVVAGHSAEDLLAAFAPQADITRSQSDSSSKEPIARVPATPPVVQRKRDALGNETAPLSEKEEEDVRTALEPQEEDATIGQKVLKLTQQDITQKDVNSIRAALAKVAQPINNSLDRSGKSLKASDYTYDKTSPHYKILQLAINKVLGHYGDILKEALKEYTVSEGEGKSPSPLAQAAKDPDQEPPLQLRHPQSLYEGTQDKTSLEEARDAIRYLMDIGQSKVKESLDYIQKNHTKGKQKPERESLKQALLDAVIADIKKTQKRGSDPLVEALVKLRVRWAPQTVDSTIYIETKEKEDITRYWLHYRQIVHEVLHTAAHTNFEAYVANLPEKVKNTIKEGTPDYFAAQVWSQVVKDLQPNTTYKELTDIPELSSQPSQLKAIDVTVLQDNAKQALYEPQVVALKKIVTTFGSSGEDRLKAAFFYGDVYHFFPRYASTQDASQPMEEENMKGEIAEEKQTKENTKEEREGEEKTKAPQENMKAEVLDDVPAVAQTPPTTSRKRSLRSQSQRKTPPKVVKGPTGSTQ